MELQKYLEMYPKSILNLGCGKTCQPEHFGIDITDAVGVDMVADLSNGIPIPDNTFDNVVAFDFVEHLMPNKNVMIMEEIYRVLKPGGVVQIIVPSTDGNNMGAFQDPTHYSFWNQMKFRYFMDDKLGGFRNLYNIQSWFIPIQLTTFFNEWNVTYVNAVLKKGIKDGTSDNTNTEQVSRRMEEMEGKVLSV